MERRYLWLDGARGAAALAVVVYHLAPYLQPGVFFRYSFLAVDLFFAMSGFVLAHAYEQRLLSRQMGAGRFLIIRLIRLYPLYAAAVLIGLAYYVSKLVAQAPNAPSASRLAELSGLAAGFLPAPPSIEAPQGLFPLAPSSWSLSLELLVNIAYGVALVRLPRRWTAALVAVAVLATIWFALRAGAIDMGWSWSNLAGGLARTVASFFLGVVIYRLRPAMKQSTAGWALAWLAAVVLILAVAPMQSVWLQLLAAFGLFPVFIIVAARSEPTGVAAWLCRQAGRLSYGVYILHAPLFLLMAGAFKQWAQDPLWLAPYSGWVFLAGILAVSWLLTVAFDEPLRRRANRLLRRRHTMDNLGAADVGAPAEPGPTKSPQTDGGKPSPPQ